MAYFTTNPIVIQSDHNITHIGKVIPLKNEVDYVRLGLRIKSERQKKGYSQEVLAEMVGCGATHVSNIENCHTKASLNVLLAIANALNLTLDYLLSDQYENASLALDNEILHSLKDCDDSKKRKILQIIEII